VGELGDCAIVLWDLETGNRLQTFRGHKENVESVVFSSVGESLASASRDCTMKLWDTETGECLRTLESHNHYVHSIIFAPAGDWLASA
jgi:WD40 repeat protein